MIDFGRSLVAVLSLAGIVLTSVPARSQIAKPSYVGAATCAGCHSEVAARYAATPMARSFGEIGKIEDAPELKGAEFFHEGSQQRFQFIEGTGQIRLARSEGSATAADALRHEAPVDYWFGSGNHARSYLSRTSRGELIELPISWYSPDVWAMSPGYDRPDHAGFSRKIGPRCLFCHSAHPGVSGGESELRLSSHVPQGIDCERCHGPGSLHVDVARNGAPAAALRSSIVNPARLPPDRSMEVCLQCHLETTSLRLPGSLLTPGREVFSYRAGESLGDYVTHFDRADKSGGARFEFVSSGYRLLQSRCYEASAGALTCITCHSPHGESSHLEPIVTRTQPCLDCHGERIAAETAAQRHPAGADCITCHMPARRAADAIRVRVADHKIVRDSRLLGVEETVERHDANTAAYAGAVEIFYPRTGTGNSHRLTLAIAQVKHDANLRDGIRGLQEAIQELHPATPEAYFELAEALRRTDRLDEALGFYRQAATAGGDWRVLLRWGTGLIAAGDPVEGAAVLERARLAAADEPAVLSEISDLLVSFRRPREAIEALRAAVEADPLDAAVRGMLGARLYLSGDVPGAEREWRMAARLRPESAAHRLNLANLLAASDRAEEALSHLRAAVRADTNHAEAHLRLGLLLLKRGEPAEPYLRRAAALGDAAVRKEAQVALGEGANERQP